MNIENPKDKFRQAYDYLKLSKKITVDDLVPILDETKSKIYSMTNGKGSIELIHFERLIEHFPEVKDLILEKNPESRTQNELLAEILFVLQDLSDDLKTLIQNSTK